MDTYHAYLLYHYDKHLVFHDFILIIFQFLNLSHPRKILVCVIIFMRGGYDKFSAPENTCNELYILQIITIWRWSQGLCGGSHGQKPTVSLYSDLTSEIYI